MAKGKKSKKLHIELTRKNIEDIKSAVDCYNASAVRITPEIKTDHVVNAAIDFYLKGKGY